MKLNRKKEKLEDLTSGPGKLTQALRIDMSLDGIDITKRSSELYIIDEGHASEHLTSKRIGISKSKDLDYRFYVASSPHVSRK